jgi:diguanylate cyclase (GGDEF)-like protein/PAS domain S-box-containing protein
MKQKKQSKSIGKDSYVKSKNGDIPHKKAEQYNLFQILIDNIPDNIYIKDIKNKFIMVNKTMADFMGKETKDFIGKTDFDFFPKEKSKEYSQDENLVMKKGKPITDKVEKVLHSGKEFWMSSSKIPWYDKNGNIMGTMGISRDITKRKQLENNLLGRERNFFGALMNNIPDSIFFKDLNSRIVRINMACAKKHGIENPEDAIGKTDFDFFSEEHAQQAYNDEQNVIKTGKPIVDFEEKETYEDKEDKWASTTKMPWYDENGNIIGIFGITRDVTDKKKVEEKVEYLSFHDALTGLYNRAFFDEELKRLDTERQLPITIVMGDLNGLKVINDAYGHARGDVFLKKIADILKESFRREDIISRWGGDEFISILPKTDAENAKNIAKRIKELCKEKSTTNIPLSISLGISTKKQKSEDIDDVLKKAEDRMYKNKISDSSSIQDSLVMSLKENLKKGDYRTETRIIKMEEYALLIGKKLKLSSIKLEELSLLLNLHNIGKLALVDEIMAKKGRLTKEEWRIIKELPEIGYRIAESSTKLKPIAESILSHHEWYNGQGYPRGIKGDEIPILSRISFLVDSYEAMTRDKPYRKKLTKKEAIKEIKRCCGTQFDPKVVDVFLEILEEEE